MLRGFTPFWAFAGWRYTPITNNPAAIEKSADRRDERSGRDSCIMAFDRESFCGEISKLTINSIGCQAETRHTPSYDVRGFSSRAGQLNCAHAPGVGISQVPNQTRRRCLPV